MAQEPSEELRREGPNARKPAPDIAEVNVPSAVDQEAVELSLVPVEGFQRHGSPLGVLSVGPIAVLAAQHGGIPSISRASVKHPAS
jgi:hypothetical protein